MACHSMVEGWHFTGLVEELGIGRQGQELAGCGQLSRLSGPLGHALPGEIS